MNKLFAFVESDGVWNTLRFVWKGVTGKFIRRSRTICMYARKGDIRRPTENPRWSDFFIVRVRTADEARALQCKRINNLDLNRLFENRGG